MDENRDMPSVVTHCDWGRDTKKRWMAVAVHAGHKWMIASPEPVGDTSNLIERLKERRTEDGAVLVGFDFPIGLPAQYGERTKLKDFKQALQEFGHGVWSDWYRVAEHQSEISVRRPFYPMRPGGTTQLHLFDGLGLQGGDALLRRCERATKDQPAACMLFWTLGGNQVGKAAITGWQEVISPHIGKAGLWPFDGQLHDLIATNDVVFAETYPAVVYPQLDIPRNLQWSKRKQAGRQAVSSYLLKRLDQQPVVVAEEVRELIADGFTAASSGEDQFDATVGLLGMLDVVEGRRPEGVPDQPAVQQWEGWILGRQIDIEPG
jgi:hypothetical protein